MKKMNKKGFTLAELLIVVAIIAVLVAIAIPVFGTQLEKSRDAADAANLRSQYSEAVVAFLGGEDVANYTASTRTYTNSLDQRGTDATWSDGVDFPTGVTFPNPTSKGTHTVTIVFDANGAITTFTWA